MRATDSAEKRRRKNRLEKMREYLRSLAEGQQLADAYDQELARQRSEDWVSVARG